MQVRIQSFLTGPTYGYLDVDTNPDATLEALISTYCAQKSITRNSDWVVYSFANKPLKYSSTLSSLKIEDGHTVYIGSRRAADEIPIRVWWILIIAAVALGLGGLLASALVYSLSGGVIPFDYGIVMDAGSSHTQITLYKWEGDKEKGTGMVEQIDSCTIEGGISNYTDPEQVGSSLLPCMSNLSSSVPHFSWSGTPVYLGATAGMRLLNISDNVLSNLILLSVRCTLQSSELLVKNVSIISGQEEGLSSWITVNFLLGTLNSNDQEIKKDQNSKYRSLYTEGALDLGGASTQITYEINPMDLTNNSNVVMTKLFGITRAVYSKSYLCFGVNEALRRYSALLLKNPTDNIIEDPCRPKGYYVNYTGNYLLNQYCTHNNIFDMWLKNDLSIKDKIYTFTGLGNSSSCEAEVKSLLKDCHQQNFTECFEFLDKPLINETFLAFSAYYKVAAFLNATDASLESYKNITFKYCEKSWSEIMNSSKKNRAYLAKYCFDAHYIQVILTEGYGFNRESWKNVQFRDQIKDADVGWSMGYMITATNALPEEQPTPHYISQGTLILLVIICIAMLVCGVFFLCRLYHARLIKGRFFRLNSKETRPLEA